MASPVHYRILGYSSALMMHGVNSAAMFINLQDQRLMQDPQLQELDSMTWNFMTIWNVLFQLIYISLGLTSDVLTVSKRKHLLPKAVKKYKDIFFEAIVVPGTFTIFSVFWPFFICNRELIFPSFIDKLFSFRSNLVLHLGIVPVVLWEIAFQPRIEPKSHKKNLAILTTYFVVYAAKINIVFYQRGLYPYPLMQILSGDMLFYVLHLVFYFIGIGLYFVQWPLVHLFWGSGKVKNKLK